jgi:membrane protein implicated in regulation of membrane protease activity
MRRLRWGIAVLVLGLWIWLSALGVPYISFSRNWPLLIVAFGVLIIVRRVRRMNRRRRRRVRYVIDDLEEGKIDVEDAISEMTGRKK